MSEPFSYEARVLDHGCIKYIEHWGSDERIIEAARMSTDKGFLGWKPLWRCETCEGEWQGYECVANPGGVPACHTKGCEFGSMKKVHAGDEKLLRYLYTEKPQHSSPFEMAGVVLEVQAPILVFREWHRHRTQSYNEMSARYTPLPDLNYVPSVERLMIGSDGKNKQAGAVKDSVPLSEDYARTFRAALKIQYADQQKLYDNALANGVPKELARVHLPVGRYSRMRASANLLNWLKFLTLRMHKKAQWEIRQFADRVGEMTALLFPRTFTLFDEERPK